MRQLETRYAKSGDVRIAYQVAGNGSIDLVFVPGYVTNLDVQWEDAGFARLLTRISRFARLIVLDKRGTGLSDRLGSRDLPNLETRLDDIRAVMDATGSGRAVLLGESEGGAISARFAAMYPERTRALALYGAYAHFYTWVQSPEELEKSIATIDSAWGSGASVANFAPDKAKDERFRAWWARWERLSASPTAAIALARMNAAIDIRPVLSSIGAPTLVLHRRDDVRSKFAGGRYLAEKIAGARLVELPGRDHPIFTGDVDRVVDEIEEFITGSRSAPVLDRVLATVLVARLVAPARLAARLGDRVWSERLARFRDGVAKSVEQFHGKLAANGPEEVVIYFDAPARAVRCAVALRNAAREIEIELAAGVHTGEIIVQADAISGVTLHVTGQICQHAKAHEILVSGVVTDFVAGAGLHFAIRDGLTIEGMESRLPLHAVMTEHHLEPVAKPSRMPSLDTLSAREREVLTLIAQGLSNPAIAEELELSDHTVKRHVANILLKLDLPTRAAAAALIGHVPAHRGL